ncbi:D-arabinono-1,4-lactone oxidase [Rhizobium sp. S152]|uniref:D-arabinono-1,4-lactone oxidase n=1 Tax=Rhizobium sp. S152 TaxID=3055038 RepID=UPI0025A93714|nr:D-arabinono-1,4-lactone oxidase [Rhizobium sp. S152]MDM9625728.1 D-arabinono-1,4-lactone oxidase [Rhizobium sp. S152]
MGHVPAANWAESFHYSFRDCLRPASADEVSTIVARSTAIKTLGSRHSFNAIVDGEVALSLAGLPIDAAISDDRRQVSVGAHCTYGDLALFLHEHKLAIHNLASLPHISIAGAIATATHGSGDRNGNLATAVAGMEIVTGDGSVVTVRRGDPDFAGMVVHLGALGVVTRVTLDVVPEFEVAQSVYDGLSWDALLANLDEITASAYSVSVFTQWRDIAGSLWLKSTDTSSEPAVIIRGARRADVKRHPISGLDAKNATDQLGVFGRWSDRLPHFKMGFTPSNGEEIQSEFHIPRRHAVAAIEALLSVRDRFAHLAQAGEFRTVAADDLWMSPQYGNDTLSVHFTWVRDQKAVDTAVGHIEEALSPFEVLPHWGKVFSRRHVGVHYERLGDFARLRENMDPERKFSNPWLEEVVFGVRTA